MRIICNRPGGFSFFGVRLNAGENIVDDDIWATIKSRLAPKYLAALLEQRGEAEPDLVLLDDAGESPLTAKEKIVLIDRCGSVDELAQYETNETRKTVLAAIERRMDSLVDAERILGEANGGNGRHH